MSTISYPKGTNPSPANTYDMPKRRLPRLSLALSLCFLLIAGLAPGGQAHTRSAWPDLATPGLDVAPGLRWLRSHARSQGFTPELERMIDLRMDQAPKVKTGEFVYTELVRDISGDGLKDELVLFTKYRIEGAEFQSKTSVTALEGDTGRKLWHRPPPASKDAAVFPMAADVGPKGGGLILVEVEGIGFETTEMTYTFRAVNDHGKDLWSHEEHTTIVGSWPISFSADNYLVTAGVFDAVKGPTSELLLASGPVVTPPNSSLQSGIIEASVLDGRDGAQTVHPIPEVGVGFVPFAATVGDLDGDKLDDYVFLNSRPTPGLGGEGEPQVTLHDGLVSERRGSDGVVGWTTGGLDFEEQNLSVIDLGDVTRDGVSDVIVEANPYYVDETEATYLIEGTEGSLQWKRPGQWPYSPGDIDKDGRADLLTQSYYSGKGFTATKVWAHGIDGNRLWKKEFRTEHPLYDCCSSLFHFDDSWGVGDVDGRGLVDGGIYHFPPFVIDANLDNEDEADLEGENIVIDARRGKVLTRGGEDLYPLGISVDDGTADIAYIEWVAPGDLSIRVMDGAGEKVVLETLVGFDIPLSPNVYFELQAVRVDGDRCGDLVLTVESRVPASKRKPSAEASAASVATYEVVMDGGNGSLLWARSIGSRDGSVEVVSRTDRNRACR